MAKKKKSAPDLAKCKACDTTGVCPACKGKGKVTKIDHRFGVRDKVLTFSCAKCGKDELIGEEGYVFPQNAGKKGSGKCKACNGFGWGVEGKLGKLNPAPA